MFDHSYLLCDLVPLLADERLSDLGPGTPNRDMRVPLEALEHSLAAKIKDRDYAAACRAALWLYHDFLDESHAISQDLDTAEGSYWHAILHRREPDHGNAKYWFRRVPRHPIHVELCAKALVLTQQAETPTGSAFLTMQTTWDAAAFVDLCAKAAHGPDSLTLLCRRIQRLEWELLFRYCHERAFSG